MRILPHLAIAALVSGQDRPTLKEWKKTQAEKKEASTAEVAKDSKMAAIRKVIDLLADLKATVLSEGEKEAKSYNKFACFCKDTMSEKSDEITKGEDDKDSLSTHINDLGDTRDKLDTEIEDFEREIEKLEKFMKEKTEKRKENAETYEKNAKDLKAAIDAVTAALQSMKASKPSFLQFRSIAGSVRQAVLLADAMGLGGNSRAALNMFLQDDPSVPMENYKFHSQPVIDLLEKLQKDFRKEKADLDSDEVDAVQTYEKYMLDKNFDVKTKTMLMERAKTKRADTIEEIAMSSAQLSTVASTLLDDKDYLMELGKLCSDKAKTWDQRSQTRADEISALTSAITIIKGEVSEKTTAATVRLAQRGTSVRLAVNLKPATLDQIEMEAEALEDHGKSIGFLQRAIHRHNGAASHDDDAQQTVAALLKRKGTQLHSTLLTALASQIAADPLAKVKTLIEELIGRLQHEATEEADHKSFCDKSIGEAEGKRDRAAESIEQLNGKMSGLEANRDKLNEEIESLTKDITDLEQARTDADDARKDEKAENQATIDTANEGLDALKTAISTLEDFYKKAKDESVDLELIQAHGPAEDAPDTGFEGGEAYKGSAKSGGVVDMLDVIKSDFERTISQTKKAEAEAEQDHTAYKDESGKVLDDMKSAKTEKSGQLDDVEEQLESADTDLSSKTETLQHSIEELLELKPACIDTGMTYQERVDRRQDEINALKKGLCVLTKFKEYGVENVAENC